jgi:hypothetical protein
MGYSNRENEVLVKDLLIKVCVEFGDVDDLRLLYKDIKLLESLIVKCGKMKVGKNKFKNIYSKDMERLIINVILRWRVIKLGI